MRRDAYTIHGGAWHDNAADAYAAYRSDLIPVYRYGSVGFRVVEEHGRYVARGGAWPYIAALARAAYRDDDHPFGRLGHVVGFRAIEEVKE
mgnify:CR=1 FL=1